MQQDLTSLSSRELSKLRDWCVKSVTLTPLSHQDRPLVSQSSPPIHTESQCFCELPFLFIIQHNFFLLFHNKTNRCCFITTSPTMKRANKWYWHYVYPWRRDRHNSKRKISEFQWKPLESGYLTNREKKPTTEENTLNSSWTWFPFPTKNEVQYIAKRLANS